MEIILLKDLETVGRKGDVVRVRDGYARNFLLPQSLALASTRANQKFVEEQKARNVKRHEKERVAAATRAERLNKLTITIEANAGDQDKLYGSVTAEDICQALSREGYEFNKKHILLKDSIRTVGSFPVTVEVYPQVKATVTLEVVRKA